MIEIYKLLTGKYDQQVALMLPKNVTGEYFTRGNCNKLLVKFSNRIVNMWNSLPDYRYADTTNTNTPEAEPVSPHGEASSGKLLSKTEL